jgi:hypothetical protein
MAIINVGNEYADCEFGLLGRHLALLDLELSPISAAIKASSDPESEGLCEAGEYFIGHGFVAIQRYLTATRSGLRTSQSDAFGVPPMVQNGLSFAAALNAGANYWKHMEEWIETINKSENAELGRQALKTLEKIEAITPWSDYTCSNLLAVLLDGQAFKLSHLLPKIQDWRDNLLARPSGSN